MYIISYLVPGTWGSDRVLATGRGVFKQAQLGILACVWLVELRPSAGGGRGYVACYTRQAVYMYVAVDPDYRGKGMECRYYRNWLGRQLILLFRGLLLVLSYYSS